MKIQSQWIIFFLYWLSVMAKSLLVDDIYKPIFFYLDIELIGLGKLYLHFP